MAVALLPAFIRKHYEVHEWKHACAILSQDFPKEWAALCDVLKRFRLHKQWITVPGGNRSSLGAWIDAEFGKHGWVEKHFETSILVDGQRSDSPTHKVDCFKNRVAFELEWNNKDPFFDRDLNNFRLLFELRAVSVGVILTRCDELQKVFNELGRGPSYGNSTTHVSQLLKRVHGGGGGGCPLLVLGISKKLYVEDDPPPVTAKKRAAGADEPAPLPPEAEVVGRPASD
jgi:hypothetical protein